MAKKKTSRQRASASQAKGDRNSKKATKAVKKTVKKATKAKKGTQAGKKKGTKQGATRAKRRAKPAGRGKPEERLPRIDKELLHLLSKRFQATRESIEQAGAANPAALHDPATDERLLQSVALTEAGELPPGIVRQIFRELVGAARATLRSVQVAYLGPEFSFTHLAAIDRFGSSAEMAPVNTISAVFEEVNRRHAQYGIVPIENSTDGRVIDTLAMFTRLPLRICGEVQLEIHLHLLANSPRAEVSEIYSKPQALSQCRDWLARSMPNARLIPVTSTSAAAQLALTKPGAAAVASFQAAVGHGLHVIAEKIEDNPHNVTRFAVIGDEEPKRTGDDRTAVLVQTPNKPGALHDALNPFKKQNVNLTWIESFPLYGPENGYQFFLDFEGHISQPAIQRTLAELEKKAVRLELLGSYPKSPVHE